MAAPAGGVTVTLTADPAIVTVTSSVVVPAGATTPATQPQITGVGLGSVTVTVTAPGFTPASQIVQVNATLAFSPPTLNLTGTATQNLTLTLSAPAPAGGVTINVKSDNVGVATVLATVQIAAGATTATVPVTGTGAGTTTIRASAPNVAEATASVTVTQGTIQLPSGVNVPVGQSAPFPITLSAPAPAGGVTVSLNSSDATKVTVTSSVTVPAGATTPSTQPVVTGVAAGTASISASAQGYAPAAQAVTATQVTGPPITVANVTVGQNLQAPVTITLGAPAPAGGVNLTVASSDPTRMLLAARENFAGAGSISLQIPESVTSVTVFAQALAGSGTVALNASAPGYNPGTGTITLAPSGFVFVGPSGPVSNFNSDQGIATPIPVSAALLDASQNFVGIQQVRAGLSVPVTLNSSNTNVGTISSPVTFNGPNDTLAATFTAVSPGGTTLTITPPSGFTTPNSNASVQVQVNPTTLSIHQTDLTVGQNLQTSAFVTLAGTAPPGGLTVTITSNDPSKLLLSTDPTAAGSASIQLPVSPGGHQTLNFFVQALANNGTATYTASAPNFGSATQTVSFGPSGFVLASPFGLGADFFTTTGAANPPITVSSGLLDSSNNFVTAQSLRGGTSASVPVTSASTTVGTITVSPVTISGGSSNNTTAFHPVANGSTQLAAGVPNGFATPANARTLTATVSTPGIFITDGASIGQNLEFAGQLTLGQPAPPGGLVVTLQSADASRLILSSSATTAGSGTLNITVPEGTSTAQYFLQALGNSGTVTYSASAPGYNSKTATVSLTPSGLTLNSPSGRNFSTTVGAGATAFFLSTAQLDPGGSGNAIGTQPLRGGLSLNVILTSSNTAVGTIQSPITIPAGTDTVTPTFTPVAAGNLTVNVQQPANIGLSTQATVNVTVNP